MRLRKEQDICLSPQRKSFNTGCYVQNVKNDTAVVNNGSNKQASERYCIIQIHRPFCHLFEILQFSLFCSNGGNIRENRDNRENRDAREARENRNTREMPRRIGSGRIISSDPPFMIRGYPENRQIPKEKPTIV